MRLEGGMKGFDGNIEELTLENDDFRKVLYTAGHSQLVLMSLKPKEDIGLEVHEDNDQFFRFESGQGRVIIDGNEYEVKDGSAIVVPAGAEHNVVNSSGSEALKLYTIYSPAHHKDGVVRASKAEAEADSPEYDGQNSE
jgi:mannose-6-phosphate isomerase-like protein (cupin superfamily)